MTIVQPNTFIWNKRYRRIITIKKLSYIPEEASSYLEIVHLHEGIYWTENNRIAGFLIHNN